MKRNLAILFVLLSVMLGCESNGVSDPRANQTPLPSSTKGYELYSWKIGSEWSYTLITGTNRNKEYDEIVTTDNAESAEWVKISVYDFHSLKQLLSRVPAQESISWISSANRVPGFSLPEASVVTKLEQHCHSLDINLQIVQ